VTDRCGIAPEITADLGQVIRYEENELKNALLKALDAPHSYAASQEKQRQAFLARFSWDKLAVQVETIYRGAIEGNEGKRRINI
jgi:glycosyltransferase involved in cell wall biosynthesis